MTHFINMVHYVTGAQAPLRATAWGGKYAPTNDPRCTAPDNTTVMLDYAEGFHTQFTSHFGSEIDNERIVFMFEKGSVHCRFGHHLVNPIVSSEGAPATSGPRACSSTTSPTPAPSTSRTGSIASATATSPTPTWTTATSRASPSSWVTWPARPAARSPSTPRSVKSAHRPTPRPAVRTSTVPEPALRRGVHPNFGGNPRLCATALDPCRRISDSPPRLKSRGTQVRLRDARHSLADTPSGGSATPVV